MPRDQSQRAVSPWRRTETLGQKIEKDTDLGKPLSARRQQRPQWKISRLLCILQHWFQKPLLDCRRHYRVALANDTGTRDGQLQQHVGTVGADRTLYIDRDQFTINSELPNRCAWNVAHCQTRMPHKIGRSDRPTMRGKITRAGTNDSREIDNLSCDQSGIVELPRPKCNVDVFADDVHVTIRQQEIDGDPRVARQKVGQYGSKLVNRKGGDACTRRCPWGDTRAEEISDSAASMASRISRDRSR
jgi:hypothetical protein